MVKFSGRFTQTRRSASAVGIRSAPQANLIVDAAIDLVAALLSSRPDTRGLVYWAVGEGDPAWDQAPVAADRTATRLVNEIYRKRLDQQEVVYNPVDQTITLRVSFETGEATGDLREFGVFGGDASAWPGSGTLVSYRRHPVIHKGPEEILDRELRIELRLRAGQTTLLHLIGGLLADDAGSAGVRSWAFGSGEAAWDQSPPAPDPATSALAHEIHRKPIDPDLDVHYVPHQRALVFRTTLDTMEAPDQLREFGLFGGATADAPGGGLLVDHRVHAVIDKSRARRLRREYRLLLGETPSIEVPVLAAETLSTARTKIAAAGLTVGAIEEEERDAPADTGRIVRQTPPAGELAVPRVAVQLTVGVPRKVVVPLLVGVAREEVARLLAQADLTQGDVASVESERPRGTVVSQAPRAGEKAARGSAVAVTIATPFTVDVPDLAGLNVPQARLKLETVRLRLDDAPFALKEQPDGWGTVVGQTPAPATRVPVDDEVAITLAVPVEIAAPDLRGNSLDEAAAVLRAIAAPVLKAVGLPSEPPGLAIGAQSNVENPAAIGSIIGQQPAANEKLPLYATVDVSVAVPVTAKVPDLIGKTQREAETILGTAGLVVGRVGLRQDRATPGTVVSQSLKAGTSAPLGSAVDIRIASAHLTEVPDVIDRTLEVARETLLGAGLQLGASTRRSSPKPPGAIIEQEPKAGENAAVGTAVTLVLSSGTIAVPNVLERPVEDARARIAAAGLTPATGDPVESAQPVDTVVAQNPTAGTQVEAGTAVTLRLAVPRRAAIPSVVGQTVEQATTTAAANGFTLTTAGQEESDATLGTIVRQDPREGERMPLGSAIAVHVAVPRTTVVPQLVALPIETARQTAIASKLTIGTEDLVAAPQNRGLVIEQSLAAGMKVTPGLAIAVKVSQGADVAVPSVVRLVEADALRAIEAADLRAEVERIVTTTHEHGTVINQTPAAGAFAPRRSIVHLSVAERRVDPVRRVDVPRLVGQQIDVAQETAERAELVMRVSKFVNGPGQTRVTAQSPAAGTRVVVGSTVLVTVVGRFDTDEGPLGGPIRPRPLVP